MIRLLLSHNWKRIKRSPDLQRNIGSNAVLGLVLLVFTLAVTPIYTLFRFKPALKVRRTLGLYSFLYVSIHFLIFIGVDYGFNFPLIREDLFEKRYAVVGFAAYLILLALAAGPEAARLKAYGVTPEAILQALAQPVRV
jgi:DMSO/TMAO reductase YedYZ heme-binding membrane subunit